MAVRRVVSEPDTARRLGQRAQLSEQNPRVDPSTVHEDFKKLALFIVEQLTEPWGLISDEIGLDNLRMLMRGLHTVEEHGEFDQNPATTGSTDC